MPNWAVIGAGNIGALLANKLSLPLVRHDNTQSTLILSDLKGQHHTLTTHSLTLNTPLDGVFICVKAMHVEEVFARFQPFLKPGAQVVLCHNGFGPQHALTLKYPDMAIYAMSTTAAAFSHMQNGTKHITETAQGDWHYGTLLKEAPNVPLPFTHLTQHPDILTVLLRKLYINAIINPLTAKYQVPNGALCAPEYALEIMTLLSEVQIAVKALGRQFAFAKMHLDVYQVMAATAANYSSMYADFKHQRPSELAHILGVLKAALPQDALPKLTQLHDELAKRETKKSA